VSVAELLDALAQTPRLPDAACRGQWELFDTAAGGRSLPRTKVIQARRDALELCHDCPALQACRDYIDNIQPYLRPRGVVAGRLDAWLEPRPPGMPLTRTRWASA
jgi:hypothetical protein